jgi:hypothetical protein
MAERDSESLLWQLGDAPLKASAAAPDAERLERYRRGELAEDETVELERELAEAPTARGQLLAGAGVTPAGPRAELRARVLASWAEGAAPAAPLPATRPPRGWRQRWFPVAAAALVALAIGLGWWEGVGSRAPLPRYELAAEGLAEVRGAVEPVTQRVRALPQTRLTLTLTPQGPGGAAARFALYRLEGDRLRRLGAADGLEVEVERGVARLTGRAQDWVGSEVGEHRLWVVVRSEAEGPAEIVVPAGTEPAAALVGPGGQGVEVRIEIVDEAG